MFLYWAIYINYKFSNIFLGKIFAFEIIILYIFILIAAKNIVCYYTNWSQYRLDLGKFTPDSIDPFLCTHIIYAFAKISNGQLAAFEWNDESTTWSVGNYEKVTNMKNANPNLKVLLAVGGWNMASTDFSNMVTSDASRANFVATTVNFLTKNKFNGLDLDWEYPGKIYIFFYWINF